MGTTPKVMLTPSSHSSSTRVSKDVVLSSRVAGKKVLSKEEEAFAQGWKIFHQQDDSPGIYVVEREVAVEPSLNIGGYNDIIGVLGAGTVVNVLVVAESEKRIRGRIESPAVGWISLVDTEDGYRWAKKESPAPMLNVSQSAGPWVVSMPVSAAPPPSGRRSMGGAGHAFVHDLPQQMPMGQSQDNTGLKSMWRQALLESASKHSNELQIAGEAAAVAVVQDLGAHEDDAPSPRSSRRRRQRRSRSTSSQ